MLTFNGLDDWIAVFKTGTHTDSSGHTRDWNEGDLDEIVEQYNPAEEEAPVVIGHPKTDSPAWGWVEGLKRSGDLLYAKFKDLVPEFVDWVKEGRYKKISIALTPDLSLKHIGFLGATPPAVKGLPSIAFKEDEDLMVIEFAEDWFQRTVADAFRRFREFIIDKYDRETADNTLPSWMIDDLSRETEGQIFAATQPARHASPQGEAGGEEKAAQAKRAKKYGIAVKEGGHVTKPSEWKDVPDDQFLDPVNYRYPCPDADQTRAAASYWGQEDNQAQYSSKERGIINKRLDQFKKKFKIGEYKKEGSKMSEITDKIKSALRSIGIDIDMSKVPDDAIMQGPKTFTEAELEAREKAAAEEASNEAKAAKDKEYAEREKTARIEARKAETEGFCENLKKEGKLLPAWEKLGLQEFMLALDGEEELTFSEQTKGSRLEWFKGFLTELPKVINFSEIATRDKDVGDAEPGIKLAQLAREKMSKDKALTYNEALKQACDEHPELKAEWLPTGTE